MQVLGQSSRFASLAAVLQESPEPDLQEDMRHWIRVYRELRVVADREFIAARLRRAAITSKLKADLEGLTLA